MDRGERWYPQHSSQYHQNGFSRRTSDHHATSAATDSVQEAQGLLAVYPMASATPTAHVTRHLSSMTITAPPPSFMQPNYYIQHNQYPQGNPPPYTEYAQELNYLATPQFPVDNSNYWGSTRDDAVRLLGQQTNISYPYPTMSHWAPSQAPPSSYQTGPFAHSVFQQTMPPAVYPSPLPGITSSSSSLAFALGHPVSQRPPPPRVHQPIESTDFFDDFLEQKHRERNESIDNNRSSTPKSRPRPLPPQESPDPLTLQPTPTPRKRKPTTQMDSPFVKRIQSIKSLHIAPQSSPVTPARPEISVSVIPTAASVSPSKSTPTPKRMINKAYVAVPPKPWLTPTSSQTSLSSHSQLSSKQKGKQRADSTHDDLGGYGSGDEEVYSPIKVRTKSDTVKSSARRTGDRDDRVPIEKLTSFFEDIFEAEDNILPDTEVNDLPEFFSPLSADSTHPLLHSNTIRKLTKYIVQVARPTKRLRQATTGALVTPRGRGRIAEMETPTLSRILKLLERNVKSGEDVDPFIQLDVSPAIKTPASPRKPSSKKTAKEKRNERRSKSQTPKDDELEEKDIIFDHQLSPTVLTEMDFDVLTRTLDAARDSILAADCCIALLGSDRLTKQLYSEELITACLSTIKNQLTKIIYPFVEASSENAITISSKIPILHYVISSTSLASQAHRRQLGELFQAVSAVLPRISALVDAESVAMSDSIIIQAVYIAIGPFFVIDAGGDGDTKGKKNNVVLQTLGKSAMRGLRLDALSLIRRIFANHEDQRSWIIEEILTSLIRLSDTKQKAGQFRLRDGHSIRTVSALLLQLVQTSAHDVRLDARKLQKIRQNKLALRRQESLTESQANLQTSGPFLDEIDFEEIRLYSSGLESATKAAKTIVLFLTQRSGKGKATKNSNEAEYRTIFDHLISDLLAVLYWPEWPAASLLLSIACKYMVSSLDDIKSTSQTDNNAAKTIALDHLGIIAARIRSSTLKHQGHNEDGNQSTALAPLDEIVGHMNIKELDRFFIIHRDVAAHLCKRSSEDQAYDSARELTAATLGQELAAALKTVDGWISDPGEVSGKGRSKLLNFGQKIKTALRDVWKEPSTDVFDIGSEEEVLRIDTLSEVVGTVQGLRSSFQPILNIILLALDAPPIFMRTKALRALGQIVTSDASILSTPNVRRAIESHLLDSSPAVRDAAVELIGKYMIDTPEVAGDYFSKIADRIADTGLSVRKRVIKLLKSFYEVTDDNTRRIDIATRLALRMLDEDDTVKDLAVKTIEELWFSNTNALPSIVKSRASIPANSLHDKASLLTKVAVIMGTSASFKDRQSPLEDMLHRIIADKEGNEASSLHRRYVEICETLIDGLVDASDLAGFTVVNCIRTIYLFTSAYPAILSGSNASTLLPYLKNATTTEEQATSDYLLKIFRASIPHLPKTALKFGHELQLALQPMIIKPSSGGGVQVLQETVACMCAVVQNLTHDFIRLVNLVKSCNARLQQAIKRPPAQEMAGNEIRALLILIYIVSLLGENCDFDRLRLDTPSLTQDINSISEGPIIEHIYNSLLLLYEKYNNATLRGRILQCLGFLFRAQPTLMTMERSSTIMDAIFSSPEEDGRCRLLKIMQDFLLSEASKHSAKEKEKGKSKPSDVNMDELVGNTDGFADSGVSSAIVQRYLDPILDAALSKHPQIQAAAVDILSFTIKQGLAHPLQSFPVIVSLETSPTGTLCNRASALHAILHGKHASLLNTRYTVSARASFEYQTKISSGTVRGFRLQPAPVALLQRWYSLVREKRPTRQDFLKSLAKVFQDNPSYESSQDDVDFTRYMAENFSSFDYKTQEEVITVIKHLTVVLSTTGTHLLELLSPSHLLTHLQPKPVSDAMDVVATLSGSPANDIGSQRIPLMRKSVIIAMVMLLKAHLKVLYSLSEEKCNKFVLGKKSAIGDKPAVKRHENPISWDRLPFAMTPLLTASDGDMQKTRFLDIWNEDGLTAEPEDDIC